MTPAPAAASLPTVDVDTSQGRARVHLARTPQARAALILGHGAGGGVAAPDLRAAATAACGQGFTVALVEQPYRVAGRSSPAPAPRLDSAWIDVVEHLRQSELADLPLVAGGRSSGARVACRTAGALKAVGVICLAFPLLPPQRANATAPPRSRLDELEAVPVPVLVVQGRKDRFGIPPATGDRAVVQIAGDHSLRSDRPAVEAAVGDWLASLFADART